VKSLFKNNSKIIQIASSYVFVLIFLNIIINIVSSSDNIGLTVFVLSIIGIIVYCVGLVIILRHFKKGLLKSYGILLKYLLTVVFLLIAYSILDYSLSIFVYFQKFSVGWVTFFGFIFGMFIPLFFIKNSKTRIIILSILGLSIAVLLFNIFYNWNKPITPYCEDDFLQKYEASLQSGSLEVCDEYDKRDYRGFKGDYVCLLKEGSLSSSECKNSIILSYVKINGDITLCDEIISYSTYSSSGEFHISQEVCFDNIINLENRPNECLKLEKNKKSCYTYIAQKKFDNNYCELIDNNKGKSSCYSDMAIFQNNLSLCMNKKFVNNSNNCIIQLAIRNKDTSICFNFNEDWKVSACILDIAREYNDASLCLESPDLGWRDTCLSYRIPETKNVTICNDIKNCIKREKCRLETKWGRRLNSYEEGRVERLCIFSD